jgi:large subunit ribosomal protein L25
MTSTYALSVKKRSATKHSAREARVEGLVPGIVYGAGVTPVSVTVNRSDLLRIYRRAGTSSLIDLDVGGKKEHVLIHDVQWHPVRSEMNHIDFLAVDMKKKTTVHVPIVFEGEAPGVKLLGGLLMKDHEHISIRCLPKDIPHDIRVDISVLQNIHDHITVADLKLDPNKFEVMDLSPTTFLCSVTGRVAEKEEEVASTEAVAEGAEAKKEEKKEEKK